MSPGDLRRSQEMVQLTREALGQAPLQEAGDPSPKGPRAGTKDAETVAAEEDRS